MTRLCRLLGLILILGWSGALAAQSGERAGEQKQRSAPETQEWKVIVVEGHRVPIVETPTWIAQAPGADAIASRTGIDKARIFVHCLEDVDPVALREILDGPPNKASTRYAQGLLIAEHIGCHLGYSYFGLTDPKLIGTSPYDRGALLDYAIDTYVPDLSLTPEETNDPVVKRRFNEREVARSAWLQEREFRKFQVAVCMVRESPALSVDLVLSKPGTTLQRRLREAIIGLGRTCLGSPKKVIVDPVQFRMLIADAVWRWVEAARDVDSLIPLPAPAARQ